MNDQLRITEIFYSLQGESTFVGLPTVFIRLTGCPLRCGYCDTEYAFTGGEKFTIDQILEKTAAYKPKYICVTGGEPLAQKNCIPLLKQLCDEGYTVSIETSGALDISAIDKRVIIVMDLKTPGSKELDKNRYENLKYIKKQDQIKFVITNRTDYDWAKSIIDQYQLTDLCEILFSPSFHDVKPSDLAEWILQDNLPVRMQIQLHKIIWGEERAR